MSELNPKDKTYVAFTLLKKMAAKIGDPNEIQDKDTGKVMELLKMFIDEHL